MVPHLTRLISANRVKQAEAPDNVVSALSEERRNSAPGPVTDAKRAELIKIRDLIDRLLASAA